MSVTCGGKENLILKLILEKWIGKVQIDSGYYEYSVECLGSICVGFLGAAEEAFLTI